MTTTPPAPSQSRPRRPARRASRLSLVVLALALAVTSVAACGEDDAEKLAEEVDESVAEQESEGEPVEQTLAEALDDAGLTTMASAVSSVDLSEVVGADEFTFLAPSDDAFLALTADELADLLKDPDALAELLRNHTIDERLDAAALGAQTSVRTEAGNDLTVEQVDGTLQIGGATVTSADQSAGQGVVHTVDTLILPE